MQYRHIFLYMVICTLGAPISYGQNFKNIGVFSLQVEGEVRHSFQDNIYKTSSDEKSDFLTEVMPKIAIKAEKESYQLGGSVALTHRRFQTYHTENATEAEVKAFARVDIDKAHTAGIQNRWVRKVPERGLPESFENASVEATPLTKNTTQAFIQRESGRFKTKAGTQYTFVDYKDGQDRSEASIDYTDKAYQAHKVFLMTAYQFHEDAAVSLGGYVKNQHYNKADTVLSTKKDFQEESLSVKLNHQKITGKIKSSASVQAVNRGFQSSTLHDVSALLWGGQVDWDINGLTSLSLSRAQTVEDVTRHNASAFIKTHYNLALRHQLRRFWDVSASLEQSHYDYQQSQDEDRLRMARVASTYKLTDQFSVFAEIGKTQRHNRLDHEQSYQSRHMMFGVRGAM